jgi:hypothetical protein
MRARSGADASLAHARGAIVVALSTSLLAGCGAGTPRRPDGPGTTDPAAIERFQTATASCAGLKTMTAEVRLSGRAGGERLRGTLHAGLAAPGALRFEAVAPFGPPLFVLAGRNNRATLLFPRDDRVLEDVALADVLDRLTALALDADAVRQILSGCLADQAAATGGRTWSGGWSAVSLGADVIAYVQERNGRTLVAAADYGPWLVDYTDHLNDRPRTVRIRSKEPGRVDLTARLDQVEINTAIADSAFSVEVPASAERLTLNDLRAIAPLRGTD